MISYLVIPVLAFFILCALFCTLNVVQAIIDSHKPEIITLKQLLVTIILETFLNICGVLFCIKIIAFLFPLMF